MKTSKGSLVDLAGFCGTGKRLHGITTEDLQKFMEPSAEQKAWYASAVKTNTVAQESEPLAQVSARIALLTPLLEDPDADAETKKLRLSGVV